MIDIVEFITLLTLFSNFITKAILYLSFIAIKKEENVEGDTLELNMCAEDRVKKGTLCCACACDGRI